MRRRTIVGLGVALAVAAVAVTVLSRQGAHAPPPATPIAVTRGDVVVSVTGIGKAVEARSSLYATSSGRSGGTSGGGAGGSAGASGSGAGTPIPAGAVFPGASGDLVKFLVAARQPVRIGQPLALIDDHGVADAAAKQARNDLATSQVELRQKRTSDPVRGLPPTRSERAAARLAVASARARLAQLLGRPRPADVGAAQAELRKAEADLEALVGGTPASIARERDIARHNVQLAQERLDRVLSPASQAEISAARAEVAKAAADLDALRHPSPAAVAAAQQAVAAAQAKLSAAQASGIAADIAAAQLELDRANADLAALTQPTGAALTAAELALDAARQKLAKLLEPANPADVTAARIELERARADLATLEAGPRPAALAAARQAVSAARLKLAQVTGPPLPADVRLARSDLGRAKADLSVLQARGGPGSPSDVQLAALKVQAASIRLSTAVTARSLLTVRAPFDGRVTGLLSAPGSPVDPLTPIAAVENLSNLAISVDMTEFDIASVKPGMRAVVSVDALGGKSFRSIVTYAAPTGTDSGGVVTFPVRVELSKATGLRPGMTASVRIIVAQRRKVIQIPLEAVTEDSQGNSIVEVIDKAGRRSTRKVTLGLANNKSVEIIEGLRAGEQIAGPSQSAGP